MFDYKKIFTYLIATVFFAVAIFRIPVGGELRALFEYSVRCGIVLLFAAYLIKEVNIWAGLFLIVGLISHSLPWFLLSNENQLHTTRSYIALDWLMFGLILYTILVKTDFDIEAIYNMMCVVALIQVVWLVSQRLGYDPYRLVGFKGNLSVTGLMANPNETSAFIAICTPAFFRRKWLWYLPAVVAGIFVLGCLNGIFAVFSVGATFLFLHSDRKKSNAFMLSAVAGLTLIVYDFYSGGASSIEQRLYIWKKSIVLTLKNQPFLGFGLGNWVNVDQLIVANKAYEGTTSWSRLHSSFIQGYVEMGVMFLAVLIGYGSDIFRRYRDQVLPICALAAIVVCCNTNSVFRINAINGMFVILWLSILEKSLRKEVGWKRF